MKVHFCVKKYGSENDIFQGPDQGVYFTWTNEKLFKGSDKTALIDQIVDMYGRSSSAPVF